MRLDLKLHAKAVTTMASGTCSACGSDMHFSVRPNEWDGTLRGLRKIAREAVEDSQKALQGVSGWCGNCERTTVTTTTPARLPKVLRKKHFKRIIKLRRKLKKAERALSTKKAKAKGGSGP